MVNSLQKDLNLYGRLFHSRLLLGTAQYPSPAILKQAIEKSETEIITVSLRRETLGGTGSGQFFSFLKDLNLSILPNTAGCYSVKEAITTAHLARDIFNTPWIKLEVIGHQDTLQPNIFALVEAATILIEEGFEVFPYMTDDLILAERLVDIGCKVLMPWCAPIGTAKGPENLDRLKSLRTYFPSITLIVDAGIGRPSHAATVMEIGYDAILLNTAIAKARDPIQMAEGFSLAVRSGHLAYKAGLLEPRNFAVPSTPVIGKAVFDGK